MMPSFDYLFLGFGPICKYLVSELLEREPEATFLISTDFFINAIPEFEEKKNVTIVSKQELLRMNVNIHDLFIATRKLSAETLSDRAIMDWLSGESIQLSRVLHFSSARVYRGASSTYLEKDYDPALNTIHNDKQELEKFVLLLSEKRQLQYCNFRISNVYGESIRSGFIYALMQAIYERKKLKILQDREYVRDYIDVRDVSSAISKLTELFILPNSINISTGIGTSFSQLLSILERVCGFNQNNIPCEYADTPDSFELVQKSVLDCSLLKTQISWKPKSIELGIREMVNSRQYFGKG